MPGLRTSIAVVSLAALAAVPAVAGASAPAHTRVRHRPHVVRAYLVPARAPARLDVPCSHADENAETATAVAFGGAVMCLVNHERARFGLGALAARPLLRAVGMRHAMSMVVNDFFGHVAPGGVSFRRRMLRAGYYRAPAVGFVAGENIAWSAGYAATPKGIVDGWMASPDHRAQILDGRFREAGVGLVLSTPPSLNRRHLPGATAAMEFGALTYASARIARNLNG
jgi:uncharacterized protein YkwD